jgi:hypothetical protein
MVFALFVTSAAAWSIVVDAAHRADVPIGCVASAMPPVRCARSSSNEL